MGALCESFISAVAPVLSFSCGSDGPIVLTQLNPTQPYATPHPGLPASSSFITNHLIRFVDKSLTGSPLTALTQPVYAPLPGEEENLNASQPQQQNPRAPPAQQEAPTGGAIAGTGVTAPSAALAAHLQAAAAAAAAPGPAGGGGGGGAVGGRRLLGAQTTQFLWQPLLEARLPLPALAVVVRITKLVVQNPETVSASAWLTNPGALTDWRGAGFMRGDAFTFECRYDNCVRARAVPLRIAGHAPGLAVRQRKLTAAACGCAVRGNSTCSDPACPQPEPMRCTLLVH